MAIKDARYSIGLEFCGHPQQMHVLRFCGDFCNANESIAQAEAAAVLHAEKRGHNHTGWLLLGNEMGVLLLRRGTTYRVAYGVDVSDHRGLALASDEFASCVAHSKECNQ
jgi:hypothetical protein